MLSRTLSVFKSSKQLHITFRNHSLSTCLLPIHKIKVHRLPIRYPAHAFKRTPIASLHSSILVRGQIREERLDSAASARRDHRSSIATLDGLLHKFSVQVHQSGRISQGDLERILTAVKQHEKVTNFHAIQIIQLCGACIPEMKAEQRRKLVEDVWNTLLSLGLHPDTSHYNALLKVHLENEHKFDPSEFLSSLKEQGIEPNLVTFQHLISRYCQIGDIENARKTLELLKSKELPLNRHIFNALILGYAQAKNMECAKEIFDDMRAAHLVPDSSTYCALASAYATTGDMENVLATIKEANIKNAHLLKKELFNIVHTLALSNFGHQMLELLSTTQCTPENYNEVINVILELVNKGLHETGFLLLNATSTGTERDFSTSPVGMYFVRQIVHVDLPPNLVIEYCNKLKESGQNAFALLKATETAFQLKKTDEAVIYLKELNWQGYNLCPHLFWPCLISLKGNHAGIYDTLKLMVELKCPADYDTFIGYAFPLLDISDPFSTITKLKDIGYEVKTIVEMLYFYYLWLGDTKLVPGMLEEYPIRVPFWSSRTLAVAFLISQDALSTARILLYDQQNSVRFSREVNEKGEHDFFKAFLSELLASKKCNMTLLEALLEAIHEKGIKISESSKNLISSYFGKDCSSNISSMLNSLSTSDDGLQLSNQSESQLADMSVTELAAYLNDSKNNNKVTAVMLHKLLLIFAKHKQMDHVNRIKAELDKLGFVYQAPTYAALMTHFIFHQDLESAMYYKEQLDEQFPSFRLRMFTILNLSILLANNKKYEAAETLIARHVTKLGNKREEDDQKDLHMSIFRLLDSFSCSENVEHARMLFEILNDLKYCKPDNILLGPLIKAYIQKNDLVGAVDEYLRIVKAYGVTPWLSELLKHLIENQDSKTLQMVVDAALTVHGNANVLFQLACAFINSGKLEQAKKVLDTPGLRIKADRIDSFCETFLIRNQIKELEIFLKLTQDVFGVDRDRMYYYLLKAFVNEENVEKALHVWVTMQEENVQPSQRTLLLLGTFLRKMNQPVPFDIPSDVDMDTREIAKLKKMLQAEDIDGALAVKNSLSLQDGSLSIRDVSEIINLMLKKKRVEDALKLSDELFNAGFYPNVQVIRSLGHTLSEIGDSDTLSYIQNQLPEAIAKIVPFSDYFAFTYINRGKSEELLCKLENEMFKYKNNFPGGALLTILSREPALLEKARRLVEIYYEGGASMPRNIFWIDCMRNHRFEEADTIYKSTPEMQTKLYFTELLRHIRLKDDIMVSQKLVDQTKDSAVTENSKGLIFSSHINALLSANKTDEALNFFHESQTLIGLKNLTRGVLVRLKLQLTNDGKKVPFEIN